VSFRKERAERPGYHFNLFCKEAAKKDFPSVPARATFYPSRGISLKTKRLPSDNLF
jgi:hypothetical protein